MLTLAQTTLPNIPGIDPSLTNSPGVKWVIIVAVLIIVVLTVFTVAITPLLVKALQSIGLIKQTWRDQIQDQVQTLAQASHVSTEPVTPEIAAKVNAIASGDTPISPSK